MNLQPDMSQAGAMPRMLLAGLLLAFSLSAGGQQRELGDVLDRMIETYGGEENLRKLDHQTQYWDLVTVANNAEGAEERVLEMPGRLEVILTYPHKREARVLNGDLALVVFHKQHPTHASEPQHKAMRLQLMRLYSPLALRERAASMKMESEDNYVALTLNENGLRADYLVNRETWRIEKVIGTLEMGGQKMQFLTEYSEFEFVEGVLMHRAENKFAGRTNTAKLKLRKVEFGTEPERTPPEKDRPAT